MSVTSDLNRVQYISEDFATYRQEATQFYQTFYPNDFNNLINTDMGNALVDQLAFAMMALSFTVNRRASENFLATAKLTKSITKLAKMLGYPISPAAPGSIEESFILPDGPYTFPVTIDVGFQFKGPGDIIYEYRQDNPLVINPGSVSGTFPLKEGNSRTLTFSSDGTENQQFSIGGIPVGNFLYADGLIVTVDGAEWSRVDLLKYESLNIFEVFFTEDPPKLRFGDGITGNIPPVGSQITVKFVYGKGLQGSVGSSQVVSVVNPLVINGQTINLTLTHPTGNVGSDPEDIRHVKAFASSFFRTQNAAVIKSDYDTIAQLESGVAIADAQIMRGVSGDFTIQAHFSELHMAVADFQQAAIDMLSATVSGVTALGVSGIPLLYVGGTSGLFVDGVANVGVSGTNFVGWNGSFVTGLDLVGVSGLGGLSIGGQGGLFVGGTDSLGVSGTEFLGISGRDNIQFLVQSGTLLMNDGVSGLYNYLSNVFSDTSKSNNVQVVVLSVDANNKYVAPTPTLLSNVQSRVQSISDAVVTVTAVDGSNKIVNADILIEIGLRPTAIEADVMGLISQALTKTTQTYGLLVRRKVGLNLYVSDILNTIFSTVTSGDVIFANATFLNHLDKLDVDGNLIINKQQVIQNGNIQIKVVRRFKRGEVY